MKNARQYRKTIDVLNVDIRYTYIYIYTVYIVIRNIYILLYICIFIIIYCIYVYNDVYNEYAINGHFRYINWRYLPHTGPM